jgi:hypothetical protein
MSAVLLHWLESHPAAYWSRRLGTYDPAKKAARYRLAGVPLMDEADRLRYRADHRGATPSDVETWRAVAAIVHAQLRIERRRALADEREMKFCIALAEQFGERAPMFRAMSPSEMPTKRLAGMATACLDCRLRDQIDRDEIVRGFAKILAALDVADCARSDQLVSVA